MQMQSRRTLSILGAAAAAACLLTQTPAWAQAAGSATAPNTMSASAAAPASALSRADQSSLRDIAEANLAEIASGQLALQKSQNDQVKQFAQMMVDDHSKALKDVQQLASDKNVKLPTGPDLKHKAVMTELKVLKGGTFDKQYISRAGVGDHKAALALLQKTQSGAKDADLKALADKMLPVVQEHLQHAQQLAAM